MHTKSMMEHLVVEPHIDEKELLIKIKQLFEYRLFPELYEYAQLSENEGFEFNEKLIELQKAIYYLDAHLEANWVTSEVALKSHWKNIENHLYYFQIKTESTKSYLSHIKKYEKHELDLRNSKSPLRFKMDYFYFYKSCDVKLLRRLIYEKFGLSRQLGSLSLWKYYDLVTEVNDDVEDVFEDLNFINANRYLIHILKNGISESQTFYTEYLIDLKTKVLRESESENLTDFVKKIYNITLQRIDETKLILDQNSDRLTEELLQQSKLNNYLDITKI